LSESVQEVIDQIVDLIENSTPIVFAVTGHE
jgi:hypothetical protein